MNAVAVSIVLTLIAGVCVALQAPTNAALARASDSTVLAALASFTIGTATLATVWLLSDRTAPALLKGAPAWAWIGGLYGAIFVTAVAYAAPRLGIASTLTLTIASQLATALILDHFGLLGLKAEPITVARLCGLALVVGGVLLVRR